MRETIYDVTTPYQQIQTFVKFARQYANDFFTDELSEIRKWSLEKLFREIRKRYQLEDQEQILRPLYYWANNVGGDCDDAFIQYVGIFTASGIPAERQLIFEAKEPGANYYSHIFNGLETDRGQIIILDNLPGTRFNVLFYPGELVRVTRVSDYL